MDILPEIIASLTKEELRNYNLLSRRTNDSPERKDLLLLQHLKRGLEETQITSLLYGDVPSMGNYYRLKNKLFYDLNKSLYFMHAEDLDDLKSYNLFLFAKLYRNKQIPSATNYFLKKAERSAIEKEDFQLLDLIYDEMINFSHNALDLTITELIKKRTENRKKLTFLNEINDNLAMLSFRLRTSQGFSKSDDNELKELLKIISSYASKPEIKKSVSLQVKIYQATSKAMLQQGHFKELEIYLIKTFERFREGNYFTKDYTELKLQMLVYICNALFKNGKIARSLDYAGLLEKELPHRDSVLYAKYLFFYYNILVNAYSIGQQEQSIDILEQAMKAPSIQKNPEQLAYVYLNYSLANFDLGHYKASLKHLVKLVTEPQFRKLDQAFCLKIAVAELIIRYELSDFDYIEDQVRKTERKYKDLLEQKEYAPDQYMLDLLYQLAYSVGKSESKKTEELIRNILKHPEHSSVIDYGTYLSKKLKIPVRTK